ncbi:MAG TPA: hypothetical protein VK541_02105 [Pedobacter sp.]|uniref:hypothetical protein n=1 Tax=Pedobacter sp. TaxID=1411316 RepID=UPI002CA46D92|nr:hypothetical protein [Pedobacter sp.]HMI01244.1 hypothetical protein [Pedobacter sp.]
MMKIVNFSCLWLMVLCLGTAYQGQAQDIKVNARLDKTSILLGDQTVLHLSAELPANGTVSFPLLADTLSAKVQIVSAGRADTLTDKNKPGLKLISRSYVITSFDPGLQMVPALVFQSGGKNFTTEALPLEVKAVAVDTTKAIYDIKQPLAVSYTFMDWLRDNWHWVAAGLAVLLVLFGLWYYFRKIRKPKPVAEKRLPLVPLHVTALEQLAALKEKKLWQQGEVKAYYSELTDIIRLYLEKRYLISAQEQTSEEILSGLKAVKMPAESRNSLKETLLLADLVKFAKARPAGHENEQSMDDAIGFIEQTRMQDQLPGSESENKGENKVQDDNGLV